MVFVCSTHIKKGISFFYVPHVVKTRLSVPCHFCSHSASFEIGYFKKIHHQRCRSYHSLKGGA